MKKILLQFRLTRMRYLASIMLFLFITGFSLLAQTSISTDKSDYAPYETVQISGSGFQPGEEVILSIIHLDPFPDPNHPHDSWSVYADEDGIISSSWYVDIIELDTRLELSAVGQTSGRTASTIFTDAANKIASISIDPTSNSQVYGVTSLSFNIVLTPDGGSSASDFNLSFSGSLPSGCSASFSEPNPIQVSAKRTSNITVTLTISSSTAINVGTTSGLTVTASRLNPGAYTITSANFGFTINKAPSVTVVTITGGPFTYTGSAIIPATVSVTGAGGLNLTPDPVYLNNVNAGTATVSYTYPGDNNHLGSIDSKNFTINKADATVTVSRYTGIYDAAVHGATGTATGVGGVNLGAGLNLGATFTDVPGGTAHWTFTGGTNYNDQNGDVAIVINKADATVSVTGWTGTYDAQAHGASGTATGVGGVNLGAGLNLGATFTDVPGGTAHWTFTGGTNYNDQNGDVAIVINKADATVSVTGWTGTYDAQAHGASGTATGVGGVNLGAGLNLGATFTDVPGGTANWTFTDVTGNYNNKSGSVVIIINQRPITISADYKEKYCGQTDPTLTFQITSGSLVGGDNFTGSILRNTGETVGLYPIIQNSLQLSSNYALSFIGSNLKIKALSTIDISLCNTIVPLGTSKTLTATISPAESGVTMRFKLDNGNGSIIWIPATSIDGTVTASTTTTLPVELYKVTIVEGFNTDNCFESEPAYLAVYDPNGGFITGGGWINSPAGAYVANPDLTGKANFGFVAKYKKGSQTPDGNTEFQFHAGNLNFSSSYYDQGSLVIAGTQAIYKGIGTINGTGSYKFMVSAVDGNYKNGTGADRFRIKISDKASGALIYDNQMGAADNATATTELGGGSIVIHDANSKSLMAAEFGVKAYPNPFHDHIYFDLQLKTDSRVTLEIYSIEGTKLATVYNDVVVAYDKYQLEYTPDNFSSGMLIYRLVVDGELAFTGKIIHR